MRQSITTKYFGPTSHRGSKVKATSSSGLSRTIEWDYALDSDGNHKAGAVALCKQLGWTGKLAIGGASKGAGNVYVFVDYDAFEINPSMVGARVELHPGCDLWMRGAKYGTVVKEESDTVTVRMDHKSVRKLQRLPKDRVTPTRM